MTAVRTALGAAFLAVLFFGVVYAVVSPALQPIIFPQLRLPWLGGSKVVDKYSLIRGTNVSDTGERIDLNVEVGIGAINLLFSDNPSLACDVAFERDTNTSGLAADYAETDGGAALHVDLYGDIGGINLTLGNSYQYNGTVSLGIGGAMLELGQHTNVSMFFVRVKYIGGVNLRVTNQASFQQIDSNVDIGGVQLTVDADRLESNGTIKTSVNIGGFAMTAEVDTGQLGVSLNATADMGGVAVNHADFQGQVSARSCSVKTSGYADAAGKLDISATVGLGGVALQQSWPFGIGS